MTAPARRVLKRAPKPIDRPSHDEIKLAPRGVLAEGVEGRALVSALRTADPFIAVNLDDVPAGSGRDGAQLPYN